MAQAFRMVVRPGDALGFRLAGVEVEEVSPGQEWPAIKAALGNPALGVVAVDQDVLRCVSDAEVRAAAPGGVPVLLPFDLPQRWGEPPRGAAYVAALIRRAIGYHIKVDLGERT